MKKLLYITIITLFFAACGDSDENNANSANHANNQEDPAEEACEHMADGPFQAVTATADAAGAPSVNYEHTSVNVTLLPTATMDGFEGYVSFEADETNEFVFFLSADTDLALTDSNGGDVAAEATAVVDACDEVAKSVTFDLEVGTYSIYVGPTDEVVSIVIEEAGAHEEHE